MFFEAIKYAAKGSISKAGAWAPVGGALMLWGAVYLAGYEIVAPETWLQGIWTFLACLGTAWIVIFFGKLFWWPYRELSATKLLIAAAAPGLEIVYDENDQRYVRLRNGATRYYVGLHILAQKSVVFPNIRVVEGEFASLLALARRRSEFGNVEIYRGGALDPDDLEIVELIGISNEPPEKDDPLSRPHRFILEARAQDVRVARKEFEYDPTKTPRIRLVTPD
jgi:hypothetical protein